MMLSLELQSLKAVHAQSGEDTSVTALACSCTANLITLVFTRYEVNSVVAGAMCGDTGIQLIWAFWASLTRALIREVASY